MGMELLGISTKSTDVPIRIAEERGKTCTADESDVCDSGIPSVKRLLQAGARSCSRQEARLGLLKDHFTYDSPLHKETPKLPLVVDETVDRGVVRMFAITSEPWSLSLSLSLSLFSWSVVSCIIIRNREDDRVWIRRARLRSKVEQG